MESHQFEAGLDEEGNVGTFTSAFNQFQEPTDKDARFPDQFLDSSNSLVKDLEALLLTD